MSKHKEVIDNNYRLRLNNAEITTSATNCVRTPDICEIKLNKINHVAMEYDGNARKFYNPISNVVAEKPKAWMAPAKKNTKIPGAMPT